MKFRRATHPIVHGRTEEQAWTVLGAIRERFEQCGLTLHPMKTRIVYCKDGNRPRKYEHVAFDFLGYTFQRRRARNRQGQKLLILSAGDEHQGRQACAADHPRVAVGVHQESLHLGGLPRFVDPVVRGWMHYYGRYYRTECVHTLQHLNEALSAWVQRKHKRFRYRPRASRRWLRGIARRNPTLFALWELGVKP